MDIIRAWILMLALPLLLPLGLLLLLKGTLGLRDGRFELYSAAFEGPPARSAGALAVVAATLLLYWCSALVLQFLGR